MHGKWPVTTMSCYFWLCYACIHTCRYTYVHIRTYVRRVHSRCLALLEELGGERQFQNHLLDLLGHGLEAEVEVVLVGQGGGVAHHVDCIGGQDLPLTTIINLYTHINTHHSSGLVYVCMYVQAAISP